MSPWKVILATMVIFGCGVITGALLMKTELPAASAPADMAQHPSIPSNTPPPLTQFQRPEFLRRMQKQLDLTASQRDEIAKIMKASQERNRPYWDQIAPHMREEVKKVREEIRQMLTPEQQTKFDEMLKPRPRKQEGAGTAGRPERPSPSSPAPTNAP
ncbi:MAG: Spy/CpxP family protein refolding chaperone [Limisphaerales bacterium]